MRDLSIITFVSLDGVMQAPMQVDEDPTGGFESGGWAARFMGEVMPQVNKHAMQNPVDLLFGRYTYDLFAGHWPNAEPTSHGEVLNRATKYVVTSQPQTVNWQNSRALTGDIAAEIVKLKSQDGPLIQVHGSYQLIQLLLNENLIDEYRLWTFPIILGSGKRLFPGGAALRDVTLTQHDVTASGVVMNFYRKAGSGDVCPAVHAK